MGVLIVSLDFDNPASTSGYSLTLNGTQTIQVGPPPFAGTFICPDTQIGEILLCSVDQPDCCIDFTIDIPPCDPCVINDLIVEPYDCNSAGDFYVDLDFTPVNQFSGSFDLYVDNAFYGNYPYSDLPLLEIGPFEGNGQVYVFTIKDENAPDCAASFELESENCINPPCGLDNLTAELVGNFGLFGTTWEFDLEYIGTGTNTSFDVYLNGDFYTFLESPTFPILMDIPCLPNNVAIIKILRQ